MDDIDAMEAAIAIQDKLQKGLDDFDATSIVFSREEAILTLGLVSALVEAMGNSSGRAN